MEKDTNDKAYLLNDYDVYLKKEPCLMCSMALVHSRMNQGHRAHKARLFFEVHIVVVEQIGFIVSVLFHLVKAYSNFDFGVFSFF